MPRVTRAAARAQEPDTPPQFIFEDTENTTQTTVSEDSSSPPSSASRPVFGELTGNDIPTSAPEQLETAIEAMPTKKAKGKKGKTAGKKTKFQLVVETPTDFPHDTVVLEDESQSDTSDAAEAAAEDLRKDKLISETSRVQLDNDGSRTPPSAAAREATNNLLRSSGKSAVQGIPPNTPKFDPIVHTNDEDNYPAEDEREDSFAENIISRSPTKVMTPIEENKEDSFVEAILTRSPNRRTSRIEDSVAEMDALDDAIEKVAEILPVLSDRDLESPEITRDSPTAATAPGSDRKTALTTTLATNSATKAPRVRQSPAKADLGTTSASAARASTVRIPIKPTSRASIVPLKNRAVSAETSEASSNASKISPLFSASPARTQPNTAHKRTTSSSLSTNRPGFVPAKSTKPTTKSTFTLPGEAVAAKLKAQREERQQREEEAAAAQATRAKSTRASSRAAVTTVAPATKPKTPKTSTESDKAAPAVEAKKVTKTTAAKPTPRLNSMAAPSIKPRETKASQARQSLIMAKSRENKENVAPVRSPPSNAKELVVKKRRPSVSAGTAGSSRKNALENGSNSGTRSARANSAIRRTEARASIAARKQSMEPSNSGLEEAGVKKAELVIQKAKGREIFGRDKIERQDSEKARKEKEEAAKRARIEASERGRQASREWAERQKKKLDAAAAAKKASMAVNETRVVAIAITE